MIDARTWITGKLLANSAFLAAIGSSNNLLFSWPNQFNNMPMVIFSEFNQVDADSGDDQPYSYDCGIQFDIFTSKGIDPLAIGILLDIVLKQNFFSLSSALDVGDPENKIEHRVQRYRRLLTPGDLF